MIDRIKMLIWIKLIITDPGNKRNQKIQNNQGRHGGGVKEFIKTKQDPDENLAPLQGVDVSMLEKDITPEEGFNRIKNVQIPETGGILGVRGIVSEPINEQGVMLLFAALCHDLGFMIEGIRSSFPDALLPSKNSK